jgi:hypothetical protein
MGAGKIGARSGIIDARYRGPETGLDDDIFQAQPAVLPDWQARGEPPPGYQQPPQGQQPGPGGLFTPIFNQIGGRISDAMFGPRQDNQQYYQQMRQNIDGMNEALKQIEGVNTPGGMYRGGGNGAGSKTGKGTANF